jgi:hypothetical protein
MNWFSTHKIRLVLVRIVAAVVVGSGGIAKADFIFGEPVNLGSPPNSTSADMMPSLFSDGLEVYFWSNRPGGFGNWDLWVSMRTSPEDEWSLPTNLGSQVNSAGIEAMPYISADGLELFFSRGSESTGELMVARRSTKTEPWGVAENLGPVVNSPFRDDMPRLTCDGLELYFISARAGGRGLSDIWMTKRPSISDGWDPPVNLSVVNSSSYDQWVNLTPDGLVLLFQSDRPGGEYGGLYMSKRISKDDPWTSPVYLGLPMKGSVYTLLSSLSADGTMLYLSDHVNYAPRANGTGGADMWQVPVVPLVDFNGDGIVDSADMCIVIDHWGENYPLCDIGQTPFGDGIVDVQDLIVVAEHLFEEVLPVGLISYWKLDETEGDIAEDTAVDNDGIVYGDAFWQPEGGVKGGALQLDGIDDYISTDFVLNPADGPFSVFAWVNSSVPGGVIISQLDGIGGSGETWLGTEAVSGKLMTGLVAPPVGRFVPKPLISESVITDGQWHNIGFVWDGTYRSLYVDGVEVAKDAAAQNPLKSATGGLYIGSGKNLEAGTFFSGLIDDIRTYNRVVNP